ncbi:MAG: alkaline phosphatase D family protein [Pseudonocardia sediminis]
MSPTVDRRTLLQGGAATGLLLATGALTAPAAGAAPLQAGADAATGPMTGHVAETTARIWARPGSDLRGRTSWTCTLTPASGAARTATATLSADNDDTLLFDARALAPGTGYQYAIVPTGLPDAPALTGSFRTAPPAGAPARVTVGMGSCAPDGPNTVWNRIRAEGCDSFVLLGDTPYIDSGDLAVARRKQRAFLQEPDVAAVVGSMPVWATWDDHDFGLNDTAGDFPGKAATRRAFVDYRANATFGHATDGTPLTGRGRGEGVYTSFRRGPIEVFLLDPRWFSRTGPSFADGSKQTFIGTTQWEWLRDGLRSSTATFKAIASGAIWDDKGNTESDDWGTYPYERDAILDFVKDEEIPGCFLVGGDIHVSRALDYGPRVGYDLWQFIVSPLHDRTIPSLNVPNPALVHSAVEPYTFLTLVADTTVAPATLTATWINRDGRRLFEVRRTATEMGHPA